jgi:CRISPR-associated protein Cmr3
MYLLITPIGSSVFKWGGISSILISGSINTGQFEPLPLPSTIYGFLKYTYIVSNIGKDSPIFRGPLLYAKGKEKEAICVHSYPSGIVCNISGSICKFKIDENHFEHRIGISIDRKNKVTKEGYIYMEKMLDLFKVTKEILNENPIKYGILIEVYDKDENIKKLNNFVGPFGGESRPAKVSIIEPNIIKIGKRFLASPAIVDEGNDKNIKWNNENVEIRIARDSNKKLISEGKITYRLISLGFETNKRLPMKLAIMPTVEVLTNKNAVGYLNEMGWGSIFEL